MTIQRIDSVLIVVDDLDDVVASSSNLAWSWRACGPSRDASWDWPISSGERRRNGLPRLTGAY